MKRRLRKLIHGFAVPLWLMGCGREAPKVVDPLVCSPESDAWYALSLRQTCGNATVAECPEADGLGDEYEQRAEEECSE